jgi:hypothetical protein
MELAVGERGVATGHRRGVRLYDQFGGHQLCIVASWAGSDGQPHFLWRQGNQW